MPSTRGFRDDPGRSDTFVRRSHVFASAVRDALETAPLREATPYRLTVPQVLLLKLMALNGAFPLRRVAGSIGVSPPAATKNADKLERLGLVVRSTSPFDRRERLLSISAAGRRLVRDYQRLEAQRATTAIGDFTPDEIDLLSGLLERFAISLLKPSAPERGPCLRCSVYLGRDCTVGHLRGGCPHAALAREVS